MTENGKLKTFSNHSITTQFTVANAVGNDLSNKILVEANPPHISSKNINFYVDEKAV